jgi:hypothetical protein
MSGYLSAGKAWASREDRYFAPSPATDVTADFFELAADLPIELEFVANEELIENLLELLEREHLRLFYVKFPVTSGFLGDA